MLKPLTLSLSLAVALGACSVSMAGGLGGGCSTCGLASPQGAIPSPQGPIASAQCETLPSCGGGLCGRRTIQFHLPKICLPKPTYTYEWVLKKKRCWNWGGGGGCETCGGVYPSAQGPSPSPQILSGGQGYAVPTTYGSGQAYGAAQASTTGSGQITPAPAPAPAAAGEEAPPAPEVAPAAPAAPSAPAPAAPAPAAPAPPAPAAPAPPGPTSSLLFSTPAGN